MSTEPRRQNQEARLRDFRRLAEQGFAALDRGEYITLATDALDGFFDEINRAVRARGANEPPTPAAEVRSGSIEA